MPSNRLVLPEMRALPDGVFLMGNDHGRPDERPAHRVSVPRFGAALAPVTNSQYQAFARATGREPLKFSADDRFSHPDQPAVGVTWFDATAYCEWLARESGRAFRLPTEAEREYAALGGREPSNWPWGEDDPAQRPELSEVAHLERPHVPSQVCANGYGLLCMVDNVHEWCSDWYDAGYYAASTQDSPRGPASGRRRASRGGAWRHQIKFNRISARSSLDPAFQYNDYGFRVYESI